VFSLAHVVCCTGRDMFHDLIPRPGESYRVYMRVIRGDSNTSHLTINR